MRVIGPLNQKGGVGNHARHRTRGVLRPDGLPRAAGGHSHQESALDWAAARQDDPLFSLVGLPRASVHKEIASIGAGYDIVILGGPPQVMDLVDKGKPLARLS